MRKPRNALALLVLSTSGLSCHPAPRAEVSAAPTATPRTPSRVDTASAKAPTAHDAAASAAPPPYFSALIERALALSQDPPRKPIKLELPAELREIRYDAYRSIRFRPDKSLWREHQREFEAQFFHPGYYYQDTVRLFELGPSDARAVPFSTSLFSYDGVPTPGKGARLEFTGFRLHSFVNRPDYRDEVVVFQGASYFRVLGQGSVYGLSARGLAINMGELLPEEFPRFSEFYLTEPGPGQRHVWVLALLESQSATGAYAFRIEPGAPSVVEIEARLFLRDRDVQLGLAPLTSMYLFGEEGPNRFGDFRPEVHDSDGLSIWFEGGEWLFRPLQNPGKTTVCSFRADRLRGFGLVQRDRDFASYQDLEARYEARPSLWVEPLSGFDEGSLRLLEIATRLETDDNVALAFVPDRLAAEDLHLRYRLHVGNAGTKAPGGAVVHATRLTRTEKGVRFLIDFAGSAVASNAVASSAAGSSALDSATRGNESVRAKEPVELALTVDDVRVLEQHVESHPLIDGHRISFELERPSQSKAVELRAFLRRGARAESETWSYLWQTSP